MRPERCWPLAVGVLRWTRAPRGGVGGPELRHRRGVVLRLTSIPGAEIELRLFAWDERLSGWEGELESSVVPPWDWRFEVGVAGVDELGVVAA